MDDDDDRLKCYHCPDDNPELACAKQDRLYNAFGSEVICPKGVRYCTISKGSKTGGFYRGCDTTLYDDMDDNDDAMGLGFCDDNDCACGQDKCNTGFHGMWFLS